MQLTDSGGTVTLCAVGDVCLGHGVERQILSHGPDFPFLKIARRLQDHDLTFANLENVFTHGDRGLTSQAHLLKCRPEHFAGVANSSVTVVSLANNHILDYGGEGLEDTIAVLAAHKIRHTGAGRTLAQARKPAIVERKGIRFGFLAYAMKGVHSAGPDSPGSAPIHFEQIAEDVGALKGAVDHVIVSLHAGFEFIDYPHPSHRDLCLRVADLGVSLIIGHHPHVIHGIERRNNCLIAYSLGNFVFDTTQMDFQTHRSQQSILLSCRFDGDRVVSHEAVPVVINAAFQPEPAGTEAAREIDERLARISSALGSSRYPKVYFAQEGETWPGINIAVNLKIIREQGVWAFLKRLPRLKLIYVVLLTQYLYRRAVSALR